MLTGLALVGACGGRATQPVATAETGATARPVGVELPAGPGRELLLRDCTGCHDLGGLELYKGFYSRDDWLVLVQTMVTHGAATDAGEAELVANYLAQHFGRGP